MPLCDLFQVKRIGQFLILLINDLKDSVHLSLQRRSSVAA